MLNQEQNGVLGPLYLSLVCVFVSQKKKQKQNGGKYKENTNWLKRDENLNKFKLRKNSCQCKSFNLRAFMALQLMPENQVLSGWN